MHLEEAGASGGPEKLIKTTVPVSAWHRPLMTRLSIHFYVGLGPFRLDLLTAAVEGGFPTPSPSLAGARSPKRRRTFGCVGGSHGAGARRSNGVKR